LARILVIADTHVRSVEALSSALRQAIRDTEYVVHCGDFVTTTVVNELRHICRYFVGVYGNADPDDVRLMIPSEATFICEGKSIAVIHPANWRTNWPSVIPGRMQYYSGTPTNPLMK